MNLLIKFASRSRPGKMLDCIANLINMATTDQYHILLTLDENDHKTNTAEIRGEIAAFGDKVSVDWGHSTGKINAINRGIPKDGWEVICATSDDIKIVQKGFDASILIDMATYFPDLDGVLQYPDGYASGILTWPVMGKKYFDRFGYIYHPSYISLFCDEEALIVARQLRKLHESQKQLYVHLHPANVQGLEVDEQLKHTQSFYGIDKLTYNKRKRSNFFIPKL